MSNRQEAKKLINPNHQKKVAHAIANGLTQFFNK